MRGSPLGGLLIVTHRPFLSGRAVPPPLWALISAFVLFLGMLPAAAACLLYRCEVCIRATVSVGLIDAGGLIQEHLSGFSHARAAAPLLYLVALSLFVDLVGAALRGNLRGTTA